MYKKSHIKNNKIKQNLRKPSLAISFKLPKVYIEKKVTFTHFNTNLMIPGIWFVISIFRHWVLLIDSWIIQW